MDFKKTRIKQVLTALQNARKDVKKMPERNPDNIKDFYLISINERLRMVEDYLKSLEDDKPAELDDLKRDYNNLLGRYQGLKKRHQNLIDQIKKNEKK